jgi:ribosomal protein S18 acetylase RimI-like enzyme
MKIRPVEASDVPEVIALVREVLAEFGLAFGEGSDTDAQLGELPGSYTREGGAFFVAEEAGRLVATAGVSPSSPSSSSGEHTFELRKMYVASAARRARLGARLLEVCLEHVRARGGTRVVLDTAETMTDAIAFYERHGFVRDDRFLRGARCARGYRFDLPEQSP